MLASPRSALAALLAVVLALALPCAAQWLSDGFDPSVMAPGAGAGAGAGAGYAEQYLPAPFRAMLEDSQPPAPPSADVGAGAGAGPAGALSRDALLAQWSSFLLDAARLTASTSTSTGTGVRSRLRGKKPRSKAGAPPPGGTVDPVLTEGGANGNDPTPTMGPAAGRDAIAEGAAPPGGYFVQSKECDAAMRVWFHKCAFMSAEGKQSLFWHGRQDPYFPATQPPSVAEQGSNVAGGPAPGSSIEEISTAQYIGNIIANENAEVELGQNSYRAQANPEDPNPNVD